MEVEWDEVKRRKNLAKHGLDFRDVGQVLGRTHVAVPSAQAHDEARFLAIAPWEGRYFIVVYTMRGDAYRIISFRRARDEEKRIYQALYA